jgi:hypothetical protein
MLVDPFDPGFESMIENQLTRSYPNSLDDPCAWEFLLITKISWGENRQSDGMSLTTDR